MKFVQERKNRLVQKNSRRRKIQLWRALNRYLNPGSAKLAGMAGGVVPGGLPGRVLSCGGSPLAAVDLRQHVDLRSDQGGQNHQQTDNPHHLPHHWHVHLEGSYESLVAASREADFFVS